MRILLVNPRQSMSLFTFSEVEDITGCRGYMPNLALPTLAALVPASIHVTLVDETVEPLDQFFGEDWDLIGITGYITQASRIFEVADEFRRRGRLVAIGGPYATLSSSTVRPHADILFIGEAEKTWPRFLNDLRSRRWKSEYRSLEPVDLDASPLPDLEKLRTAAYHMGVVQTSRGCPFECEFCDVIVYLGRKQRYKQPQRVVEELERMYRAGYRSIFLSDDNFTAHRKKAYEIIEAIGQWKRAKPERVSFATQLSIDVAKDPDLLRLCADAGLKQAFVGIETPNQNALREVKKRQNLRVDLAADVHSIQRAGLMVQAGMICGFDADTTDSFRLQYEFAQRAGIPMVSVTMLNAPEGTPLEKRLLGEGRLTPWPMSDMYFSTNIVPKRMTQQQLRYGTQWLLNKLYAPDAFLERVSVLAQHLPAAKGLAGTSSRVALIWHNLIHSYEWLGSEFRHVPREAVKMFRGKDTDTLGTALIFYKNAVSVLRKWSLWEPAFVGMEQPDFGAMPAAENPESTSRGVTRGS
jgi:radical SAM superfamily enzyme YgiQ (UPF0313 family)